MRQEVQLPISVRVCGVHEENVAHIARHILLPTACTMDLSPLYHVLRPFRPQTNGDDGQLSDDSLAFFLPTTTNGHGHCAGRRQRHLYCSASVYRMFGMPRSQ